MTTPEILKDYFKTTLELPTSLSLYLPTYLFTWLPTYLPTYWAWHFSWQAYSWFFFRTTIQPNSDLTWKVLCKPSPTTHHHPYKLIISAVTEPILSSFLQPVLTENSCHFSWLSSRFKLSIPNPTTNPGLTMENCQRDICPGNICQGNNCPRYICPGEIRSISVNVDIIDHS